MKTKPKVEWKNLQIFLFVFSFLLLFTHAKTFAQFGQNKVQYDKFDWMYIQSEHFDIYYDKGSKYLAEFCAIEAEKALNRLQFDLNYSINRRVPILLYNSHVQFQQSNAVSEYMPEGVGGVTELFKNRVVLPFDGNYESFRHVIAHELTHAVLNDMFYGGTFQTALSASGSMFEIPIWMNEGLAEWESLKTLTTLTDMYIRDLVINNLLPNLNQLNGYLAYRGGQIFYWYIAENFGQEKIGELINKLSAYHNVDLAFKSTFNLSLEEFSDKWMKDLKKMYLPDVKTFQDPEDFAERLTNHTKEHNYWNSSPSISPNGQKYAYISVDEGVFAIYTRGIDKKSKPEKLVSSFRQQDFEELNVVTPGISWNPKGDKLAISAKAGGENAVFIVDVNTGDYEKLSWGLKSITSVTWSPDGTKLAFTATLPYQSDIFVYEFATKKLTNLTDDVYSDGFPEWSSDSQTLYFVSDRGDDTRTGVDAVNLKMWKRNFNRQDIYSIDLKSQGIKRLTFDQNFNITSLAASSNQSKLLYSSDKNGINNIYALDLNSLKSIPITNSIIGITQISLSPDASKLLFSGQIDGGYDIFLIRFPFEKKINTDTLPLTEYRQGLVQHQDLVQELNKEIQGNTKKNDSTMKLPDYGKFSVDFSHQSFVSPNPDAIQQQSAEQQLIAKGEQSADTSEEFVERPYKIKFSTDVILGNPGYSTFYGFQGLTQMLFSDVLGDHQIYAQANLLTDLRNSSFLVSYSYLPNLIDYGASIYHSSAFVYGSNGYIYRYRNYGLTLNASLPFDLFRRVEANLNWMNLSKENVEVPQEPSISRMLVVPSVRYVFDNTLWGIFGPAVGSRYYFGIMGTPKLGGGGVSFYNFDADIRYYQPIINNYLTLAMRGAFGGSFGGNPTNYFLGGTENWINSQFFNGIIPFDDPVDFGFMQFEMPLRGWSVGEVKGHKFFLINSELRFPLFTALVAGPVPILLQGIMGSFFFDIGGAFDKDFVAAVRYDDGTIHQNNLLMSSGIGVRAYLFGLPIKMDIAWRNEYFSWSQPQYLFSLGYDF
jgi:Tol biopolymer transport system component